MNARYRQVHVAAPRANSAQRSGTRDPGTTTSPTRLSEQHDHRTGRYATTEAATPVVANPTAAAERSAKETEVVGHRSAIHIGCAPLWHLGRRCPPHSQRSHGKGRNCQQPQHHRKIRRAGPQGCARGTARSVSPRGSPFLPGLRFGILSPSPSPADVQPSALSKNSLERLELLSRTSLSDFPMASRLGKRGWGNHPPRAQTP